MSMCQPLSSKNLNRSELLQCLFKTMQDSGNANILLVNAIANRVGLSATEFECMSVVSDHGPMTAGELAKRCGITSGGLTGLVDRMVRMKFLKRQADEKDRRRVLISLVENPEASKKVIDMYAPLTNLFQAQIDKLTDDQLRVMLDFHLKMNEAMVQVTENLAQLHPESGKK